MYDLYIVAAAVIISLQSDSEILVCCNIHYVLFTLHPHHLQGSHNNNNYASVVPRPILSFSMLQRATWDGPGEANKYASQ